MLNRWVMAYYLRAFAASLIVVMSLYSPSVRAHDYLADVDQSKWFVEPSRLNCRLRHPVPHYGDAVFEMPAGSALTFFLNSRRAVEVVEPVIFEAWAPAWRHNAAPSQLGVTSGLVGNQPAKVGPELASNLLSALEEGFFPVVTHRGWYTGHRIKIAVSSVNFGKAYETYLDCLTGLLPVGFDQIVRSSVLFETDKAVIRPKYKERLALIAEYMSVDASVQFVVIDGHTDSRGRNGYNWDLSRRRAESVRAELLGLGLPADQVVLRYHGESFPIDTNKTKKGRRLNRRVTLRLERDPN
jgi:outer membrane protein OmpA-like peptidoglycan-associated protein